MWLDLKCRSVYFKINWSTSCATVWWGSRSSFLISLSPEEIFIGHSKSWIPLGETEKNIFSWTVAEVKCSACSSSTPTILVQIQLNCLKWTKWTKKRPRMVWFKNALFKMKDQTKGFMKPLIQLDDGILVADAPLYQYPIARIVHRKNEFLSKSTSSSEGFCFQEKGVLWSH